MGTVIGGTVTGGSVTGGNVTGGRLTGGDVIGGSGTPGTVIGGTVTTGTTIGATVTGGTEIGPMTMPGIVVIGGAVAEGKEVGKPAPIVNGVVPVVVGFDTAGAGEPGAVGVSWSLIVDDVLSGVVVPVGGWVEPTGSVVVTALPASAVVPGCSTTCST